MESSEFLSFNNILLTLLSYRPTVQEDGGDIIFKVCWGKSLKSQTDITRAFSHFVVVSQ